MLATLMLIVIMPLVALNALVVAELLAGGKRDAASLAEPIQPSSVVVLIPAHNEERAIARTVAAIRAVAEGVRIVVVADNCCDATADNARTAGAEVVERHDLSAVGKGHALAFGRTALAHAPPACVVMLDADTHPAAFAIERLVAAAVSQETIVQAAYWLEPHATASIRTRVAAAAFYLINVVRQKGLYRITRTCMLTGSGMAASWAVFERLPIATSHLTEDLMLGIWCLEHRLPPVFASAALVSAPTSSDQGTATQRTRWESGRAQVVRRGIPTMTRIAVSELSFMHSWIAARLLVPPLAVLFAINVTILLTAPIVLALPSLGLAYAVLGLSFTLLMIVIPVSLLRARRRDFVSALVHAPGYVAWKIGLALTRRTRPTATWRRTERD